MEKKEVTIEDLARMVQQGFEETAKRAEVNKEFEQVNEKFDKVENCLERVNFFYYNLKVAKYTSLRRSI